MKFLLLIILLIIHCDPARKPSQEKCKEDNMLIYLIADSASNDQSYNQQQRDKYGDLKKLSLVLYKSCSEYGKN